nr:uncharacterized protein LOC113804564 [Penaeus vannamei]
MAGGAHTYMGTHAHGQVQIKIYKHTQALAQTEFREDVKEITNCIDEEVYGVREEVKAPRLLCSSRPRAPPPSAAPEEASRQKRAVRSEPSEASRQKRAVRSERQKRQKRQKRAVRSEPSESEPSEASRSEPSESERQKRAVRSEPSEASRQKRAVRSEPSEASRQKRAVQKRAVFEPSEASRQKASEASRQSPFASSAASREAPPSVPAVKADNISRTDARPPPELISAACGRPDRIGRAIAIKKVEQQLDYGDEKDDSQIPRFRNTLPSASIALVPSRCHRARFPVFPSVKTNSFCPSDGGKLGPVSFRRVARPKLAIYNVAVKQNYPGAGSPPSARRKTVSINIIEEDSYEKDVLFYVDIGEPQAIGDIEFDIGFEFANKESDLTEEEKIALLGKPKLGNSTRTQIRVKENKEYKNMVDKLVKKANASLLVGTSSWKEQFSEAITVQPGDEDEEGEEEEETEKLPSCMDYVMHFVTVFWKILFAFIPPTDIAKGYPTFIISILGIGLLTAFIGDFASHFGCSIGLKDSVTAIAFVALGTSVPDTFASKVAAQQDPYADASVGNVTGSNAVNVFLGIGIAWTLAAIYHNVQGRDFEVLPGNLAFSVTLFCVEAAVAIMVMMIRRHPSVGGELGGPRIPKIVTSAFLAFLWVFYVFMSSLEAYDIIPSL